MANEFPIARLQATGRELMEWAEIAAKVQEPIELHSCDGQLELRCAGARHLRFAFIEADQGRGRGSE